MPNAPEDFVHRIGRTGRAGAKGVATTFVMPQERVDARRFEVALKVKFNWREADKNLAKEERNKPLDLHTAGGDLMALESRSWRIPGSSADAQPSRANGSGAGSGRRRRSGGGGGFGSSSGGGHSSGNGGGPGRRRRSGGRGPSGRG